MRSSLWIVLLVLWQAGLALGQSNGWCPQVVHTPLPIIINRPLPGSGPTVVSGSAAGSAGKTDAPVDLIENLLRFDPEQLELEWTIDGWRLKAGDCVLKDFGRNEAAARQTQLLALQMRLNQYGKIGSGKAALEYWLCDGQAPCATAAGMHIFPLDQASLRLERNYGQWCVRDTYRVLLNFEVNENDARQALAVLKKYRFSQVGSIGYSNPPVLIFLTRPGDEFRVSPGPGLQTAQQRQAAAGPTLLQTQDFASGQPVTRTSPSVLSTMGAGFGAPPKIQGKMPER